MHAASRLAFLVVLAASLAACGAAPTERTERPTGTPAAPATPQSPTGSPAATPNGDPTWDVAMLGVPRILQANYIDVARIAAVSRFRSGIGHDYSDDFERCRSMKHYFRPAEPSADWGTVALYAPVSGVVTRVFAEWAGSQVQIRSASYPAFTVILFHVSLARPLAQGDTLVAGTTIGTHVGSVTTSDVAIMAATPRGRAFVSYFDALPDELFAPFAARGAGSRALFVIPRAERDATPLACDGEAFHSPDQLATWVELK
jgi:hypothetical protein